MKKYFLLIITILTIFLYSCDNNTVWEQSGSYIAKGETTKNFKVLKKEYNADTKKYEVYIEVYKNYEFIEAELIVKDKNNYILDNIKIKKENLKANNTYIYLFDLSHVYQYVNSVTLIIDNIRLAG